MADETKPQSYMESALPETSYSMRFARLIIRNRFATLMTLVSIGIFCAVPLFHAAYFNITGNNFDAHGVARFKMDTKQRNLYPEHPFIHAQDKFTDRFGTGSYVSVAVVKKEGDIYDSAFLEKVARISDTVDKAPVVNHYQVRSLTHINTRVIRIEPDGGITAEPIIEDIPEDDSEEMAHLRDLVHENPGLIHGFLVSKDDNAVQIAAGFITHRLDNREKYEELWKYFMDMKAEEEADGSVNIYISGQPIVVGWTYFHAFDIIFFLLLTITLLFFLLLGYFRRLHGVAIPMVAGLATAIWGLGFCAWIGINLDPLILVIPLLLTARAISHTIQMAERFFEDYEMEARARMRLLGREMTAAEIHETKLETSTSAMAKLMVAAVLAVATDALGMVVIFMTTIQQMRDLAVLGCFWVIGILFNVILLHPIMIAYLPPPHEFAHFVPRTMSAFLNWAGRFTTSTPKYAVVAVSSVFLFFATIYVLRNATVGETAPGAPIFWPDHEFNISTGEIGKRFGGVDQFTVFIDGDGKSASSDGIVLQKMEAMQRWMTKYVNPGASISLVSIIRVFWEMNHYGDPKWGFVPDNAGTIGGIIFNLQNNNTPGFLRPFLTDDAEDSNIQFFFPDHKGDTIKKAVHWAEKFIRENPMGRMSVRLVDEESDFQDGVEYIFGPMIPPRARHLEIFIAEFDDENRVSGYQHVEPRVVREWTQPIDRAQVEANVLHVLSEFRPLAAKQEHGEITLDTTREELGIADDKLGKAALRISHEFDYRLETVAQPADDVILTFETVGEIVDHIVDRSVFFVDEEWDAADRGIYTQMIRFCRSYCDYELWVRNEKFKDTSWNPQRTGSWTRGSEFVLAGGIMGIYGAVNEEVERGNIANVLLIFVITFLTIAGTYRSVTAGSVIVFSLATATMASFLYMAWTGMGFSVQTLPVQSVGVGVGVDYATYLTDRIRQEYAWSGELDEGIRRAIRTTGMAVSFTATTLTGGILAWSFSELKYQAEMARLLSIILIVNWLGGILLVPACYSIIRPAFFAASLMRAEEQQEEETQETVPATSVS